MAPPMNSEEFPLLASSTTYGDQSCAESAPFSNTSVPSRIEGQHHIKIQQLVIQQRIDIASMQLKHDAQLQALAVTERRSQLKKQDCSPRTDVVTEFIGNIDKKSVHSQCIFACAHRFSAISCFNGPAEEFWCGIQTWANTGTPLLAITQYFQMPYYE